MLSRSPTGVVKHVNREVQTTISNERTSKMTNICTKKITGTVRGQVSPACNKEDFLINSMRSCVLGLRESDTPFLDVPLLWTISSRGEFIHWDLEGLEPSEQYQVVPQMCNEVNACLAIYEVPGSYSEFQTLLGPDKEPVSTEVSLDGQLCIFLYGATKGERYKIIQPYKGSLEEPGEPLDYIEHDQISFYMKMPWFEGVQWCVPFSWY
jgi:hypothetical protein